MSSTHSANIETIGNNSGTYRRLHQLLSPGPELDLHCRNTQARAEVERYIGQQFQAAYGATVSDFLPLILSLTCNDKLAAVTGICAAGLSSLISRAISKQPH